MLIHDLIVEGSHRELPSLLVLRDASYEVNFLTSNSYFGVLHEGLVYVISKSLLLRSFFFLEWCSYLTIDLAYASLVHCRHLNG